MSGLSERDMRILAFERRGWRSPGVKEQAIAEVLDMPATRYYQLLNELIDRPEALAFDPVLVKRLRAQRAPPAAHAVARLEGRKGAAQMISLAPPATPEGQAGLDALLADPRHALVAADFDGTLAPIVDRPGNARAHPGAVPALTALAGTVGTLAIITGRPAADAVDLGGFEAVPGLIVIGHYGWQRWQDGQLTAAAVSPAVEAARGALPGVLRQAGAPDGTWIEDKAHAVAVHTRGTADPEAALRRLRDPLGELAAGLGLDAQPGRFVIELRPPGVDKGTALTGLVGERAARSVLFCGDDLGDLPAFAAVRSLRAGGIPGCAVASASAESPQVAAEADLVVPGPDGIVALFAAIAGQLRPGQPGR